jgi:predicted DsbA family dithiol-disulfide isomerase/SAM-dependent methyltransferase
MHLFNDESNRERELGDKPSVEFTLKWRPYFLDETLSSLGSPRRSYYEERYGEEAMTVTTAAMEKLFKEEGLHSLIGTKEYNLDGVVASSLPALRLLALAQHLEPRGAAASRVSDELFRAYFGPDKMNLACPITLERVAARAELPNISTADISAFLKGNALTSNVVTAAAEAKASGLSIPHFEIRSIGFNKSIVSIVGAPEVEELVAAFRELAADPLVGVGVGRGSHGGRARFTFPAFVPGVYQTTDDIAPQPHNLLQPSFLERPGDRPAGVSGAADIFARVQAVSDSAGATDNDDGVHGSNVDRLGASSSSFGGESACVGGNNLDVSASAIFGRFDGALGVRGDSISQASGATLEKDEVATVNSEMRPVPQATALDETAAIIFKWRCDSLLPSLLKSMGGDWPSDCPLEAEHFGRLDKSDDMQFYAEARVEEQHLDSAARAALTKHYANVLARAAMESGKRASSTEIRLLDLCSSFESHLPEAQLASDRNFLHSFGGIPKLVVHGVGMNVDELKANRRLSTYEIHDLNSSPFMPGLASSHFDIAFCALSVDYLTQPLQVFAEVHRTLMPGGRFVVAFSNRLFRSKAVELWRDADTSTRLGLVAAYFHYSVPASSKFRRGGWVDLQVLELTPDGECDPLFVVQAIKAP